MRISLFAMFMCYLTLFQTIASQNEPINDTYAAKIREYTTDPAYLSDLVDHLPKSETVPSPLDHFGNIIGAPDELHYVDEIYAYLTQLAEASPRVSIRAIGETEENRSMIEVIIADESTLLELETYRRYLNQLSDPRGISEEEMEHIVGLGKPVYYVTGGLHSPETGSPEMLMELAYRLAVGDSPLIRNIRENLILVFVPVAEPDGRDRMVDAYYYRKRHQDVGPPLVYWGHYVAHDNNRDGYGLALALTRNILAAFLHWKPTVGHDLHESVPYLYISTGTGPYNEYLDPITIDEWHNLAHEEVTALTSKGMPGVWTHGFYTGWAANYLLWIPNNRNAIGRFYETFGNAIPETKERKLTKRRTSREWYRPNPPHEKTLWSFRNNINYMQTALLTGLNYVADHRSRFLKNFYIKSQNAIERGKTHPPFAFLMPRLQKRTGATLKLVNLLRRQGLEIHRLVQDFTWTPGKGEEETPGTDKKGGPRKEDTSKRANGQESRTVLKGSFVVRMDQPYRTLARILLDKQTFPVDEKPPYDDTGWTLPLLRGVEAYRVEDQSVLSAEMELVTEDVPIQGRLLNPGSPVYLINHNSDDGFAVLRFQLKQLRIGAAEAEFDFEGRHYNPGTYVIRSDLNGSGLENQLNGAAAQLGLTVVGVSAVPEVKTHEVRVPRIALVHTWVATPQAAGWWRLAFDRIGIPYTYLSEQEFATVDLSKFDVVVFPNTWANTQQLISGTGSVGDPIPWKQTEKFRNIGVIDETEDVRKGMTYQGLANLSSFVNKGGVLITEGNTAAFAIDTAITRRIRIEKPANLEARGSVLKAVIEDKKSPIVYGYDDSFGAHFSQAPVFRVNKRVGNFLTPEWMKDRIWAEEVPRTVVSFAKEGLLMSGMLRGEKDLAGRPAVVDVPVGKGHVVMFAIHPFWRWETHASHALVFNTMLHWDHLRAGWPERPAEDEIEENESTMIGKEFVGSH